MTEEAEKQSNAMSAIQACLDREVHLSEKTFKKIKDDIENLKKKKHVEKMIDLF